MSANQDISIKTSSSFTRYRGLIVSIGVFLLLIIALMTYSTFSSQIISNKTNQLSAMEQLHSQYQQTVQRLYGLGLASVEGRDPKSPFMSSAINALGEHQRSFNEIFKALSEGGLVRPEEAGGALNIKPLQGTYFTQHLQEINTLWQPSNDQITLYLQDASSLLADDAHLREAVVLVQNTHALTHEHIGEMIKEISSDLQNSTRLLGWVQIGGIAAAVVYFLVFINFFMRRLGASDRAADAARQETTEILNTVTSGLFLLDRDLQIGNQYSSELENLIGTRSIANRNLLDILHDKLPESELENTAEFVEQLYKPHVKERLVGSLNPLVRVPMRITNLKTGEEKNRYLSFRFNRVYHGKNIDRVLVSVTDETDAVLLEQKIEQEREQNDIQLDMLSTLLSADQKMVNDFIKNTKRRNLEINNILKQPGEKQVDLRGKADAIFREVHSLKGEASTFKLNGFVVLAENLESELKKLRNSDSLSGEAFLGLAVSLEKLMQLTQTIESLARRLSGSNNADAELVGNNLQKRDRFDVAGAQQAYYTRFVSDLAKRNHKKVTLACSGLETQLNEETDTLVKEIVIQLLRNSVVHGIETPQERLAKNKQAVGYIQLSISENAGNYTLFLRDDGAGIQAEKIRRKAVELGLFTEEQAVQLTEQQLYALLFRPGFSTAETLSSDAGRGVGLDIIKERIVQMGGKISVSSKTDAFTRFAFTFPKK